MARLGFDWPRLHEFNPALIYCAISGFGQTGPMSQAPAYDQVIQGLSGMMSVTGTPETAPLRVGFPVCDTVGGLTAALAVAAAIVARQRDGAGRFLDVSMLESSMAAMGWSVSNYVIGGVAPEPMGDQNATAAPSGTFDAADGPLNIAANQQQQYETLCRLVERPDLIDDARFLSVEHRKRHRDELNHELNKALNARPALVWEQLLSAAGVPAARILTVPEAVSLEQLEHREFFQDLPFPGDPTVAPEHPLRVSGNGVLVNGSRLRAPGPPPRLGENNDDIAQILRDWSHHDAGR
jgi:crotonobetainyl-CoA:carnitine CoA-transferase CaiB-like acyl-CoA transferase